ATAARWRLKELLVDRDSPLGHPRPVVKMAEASGRKPPTELFLAECELERVGNRSHIERIEERRVVAHQLEERGRSRTHDRCAGGERLGDRKSEALVQGGKDEQGRSLVGEDEVVVRDESRQLDAVG